MSSTAAETPNLELHFKPASFWSTPLGAALIGLSAVVAGFAFAIYELYPGLWQAVQHGLSVVIALLLVAAGIGTARARSKAPERAPLRVFDTHLEVPRAAGSRRTRRIDYADILSLNVAGREPRTTLLLGTKRETLGYPKSRFMDPDAIGRLLAEVQHQLARRPGGDELIARMVMRDAVAQAAWAARPWVTMLLLASVAVAYLASRMLDANETPFGLLRFGANAPVLVADGQWFRLFAANFLHANPPHLYMNGLGLLTLGALLERLLGPWRFTTVYLVSALGGAAASAAMARAPLSVGASTAIFGLLGAMAWLEWRFRTELPGGFRQSRRWWIIILGLNAFLPLLVPQIDFAAHAGGFVAGALATRWVCPDAAAIRRPRPAPPRVRAVTALLVVSFTLALGQAALHASGETDADRMRVEDAIVTDASADAELLNQLAWQYAIAPSPSRAELDVALRAATSACTLEPDESAMLDTLATVHYRLGNFESAIEIERRALARRDDAFTRSQLSRFLDARVARGGPMELGGETSAADVSLALQEAGADGTMATLRLAKPAPRGAEVWVLAKERGTLRGSFVIQIGSTGAGEWQIPIENAPHGREPLELVTALIDAGACADCTPETRQLTFHPFAPEASALPGPIAPPR